MNPPLLLNFAALARRVQDNYLPKGGALPDFSEGLGVLLNEREGDPRGFSIQPLCVVMEHPAMQDRTLYRKVASTDRLLEIQAHLLEVFSGAEHWAIHQYVRTTQLLVEEGYAVHLYTGDENDYAHVPPLVFTDPTAPVPIVCIQEVDVAQFKKILQGLHDINHMPDDSVKH